jgi:hypothetical protein
LAPMSPPNSPTFFIVGISIVNGFLSLTAGWKTREHRSRRQCYRRRARCPRDFMVRWATYLAE